MIESVVHLKVTVKDGCPANPDELAEMARQKLEEVWWEVSVEPVSPTNPRS